MMARREWAGKILVVVLLLVVAGCESPGDENWIRVKQFEKADDSSSGTPITSLDSPIRYSDIGFASTDYVDVVLENQSTSVGTGKAGGEAVTLYKAHVSYSYSGYSLPEYDYAITLHIPPMSTGTSASIYGAATATEGQAKLTNLAIVPYQLKSWLYEHIPSVIQEQGFQGQAKVTFQARTDQGTELEADGGLTIFFYKDTSFSDTGSARVN